MKYAISLLLGGTLLLAGPATAADLGWGGGSSSTLYSPSSAFNWSGFYAGANAGFGWGTFSREPAGGGPTSEDNSSGWVLGGHAGYNVDFGGFVLGAEADLQWSSLSYDQDLDADGELKASIDAFGTIRGRAGASFGQVMPYVTGGLAYGRGTVSITDPTDITTSQSRNHWGWTAGVGLEAAATENLTLRAEYLYVDLGTQTYATAPGGDIDASHRFSVIRGGVSYKF